MENLSGAADVLKATSSTPTSTITTATATPTTTTTTTSSSANTELEQMKKRIKELEEEAKKLEEIHKIQSTATNFTASPMATDETPEADSSNTAPTQAAAPPPPQIPKLTQQEIAEIDSRSIYVGNVDWSSTPEELQSHFQACGIIKRITIPTDKRTGTSKGFAYIEFSEPSHLTNAMALNESLFRNRLLKVIPKRTNTPGFGGSSGRGGPRGGGRGTGFSRGGPRGNFRGGRGGNGNGRSTSSFSPY